MNEFQKKSIMKIARMSSEDAAQWVVENYPISANNYGDAFFYVCHRTWKVPDQKKLARYYFKKLPFSSERGYEAFASIMSMRNLICCVKELLPSTASDKDLLLYHLLPVLNKFARNEGDQQLVFDFCNDVNTELGK